MKKIIAVTIVLLTLCAMLGFHTFAEEIDYEKRPELSYPFITSKDKLYEYAVDKETGEAYFYASLDENITVLNVPDEIDGRKVVGFLGALLSSKSVTKINLSKNIKSVLGGIVCSKYTDNVPVCSLNLNEGLEVILGLAINDFSGNSINPTVEQRYKYMILPKSLKYIGGDGVERNFNDIVFQSDPITRSNSVTLKP